MIPYRTTGKFAEPETIVFPGLDDALIGFWDDPQTGCRRAVYSGAQILVELGRNEGMTVEEAIEWTSFNIEGAYFGPRTPIIVWE